MNEERMALVERHARDLAGQMYLDYHGVSAPDETTLNNWRRLAVDCIMASSEVDEMPTDSNTSKVRVSASSISGMRGKNVPADGILRKMLALKLADEDERVKCLHHLRPDLRKPYESLAVIVNKFRAVHGIGA